MEKYFIADSAELYGDVTLGENTNIRFQVVARGDSNIITIGDNTNIQDGSILHVDHDAPLKIGKNITIGHLCLLHGCQIKEGALVGMNTTILNHAVIGENSMIGAGSLVTERTIIPPNVLAFGRPARVIRPLTEEEIEKNLLNIWHYTQLAREYQMGKYIRINGGHASNEKD